MLSIGILGDIIPNDYNDMVLGNLLEIIMVSGFKILDLYFNLCRGQIRKASDLQSIRIASEGK